MQDRFQTPGEHPNINMDDQKGASLKRPNLFLETSVLNRPFYDVITASPCLTQVISGAHCCHGKRRYRDVMEN